MPRSLDSAIGAHFGPVSLLPPLSYWPRSRCRGSRAVVNVQGARLPCQPLQKAIADKFHRSHAGHMPYLWQGALSIVSQTLLIMGATMSPSLNSILCSLVPRREMIDQIIADVIMEIERYSVLSPSLSLSAEIIKEAEVRRRTFLST